MKNDNRTYRGDSVIGVDSLNSYYDVRLKEARLQKLLTGKGFIICRVDIADRTAMERIFASHHIDRVVHLAAQAGVR